MGLAESFILKVKRAETPGYRLVKKMVKTLFNPPGLPVPAVLKPVGRTFYELHYLVITICRGMLGFFYRQPLFQSRCARVGINLRIESLPYVNGPVSIHLGDNVSIGGNVSIQCGAMPDAVLRVGDRTSIGWNTSISVGREVVIDEDVLISFDCRIFDNDGHPRDTTRRVKGFPADPLSYRPVHICRYAWIGNGTQILKGVTIGEGAIIGSGSIVRTDIPPYSIAFGNPAEVRRELKTAERYSPDPASAVDRL